MENKRIKELREELIVKVKAADDDLAKGTPKEKAKEHFESVLSKLNDELFRQMCAEIRATENPMLEAIKRQTYTEQTVKCVFDRKSNASSFEIGTKAVGIDPIELQEFIQENIGNKHGWEYVAENLGRILAARKAGEIGSEYQIVLDTYKMSKQSKRTTESDPLSDATALKWLQATVDAMYFAPYKNKNGEVNPDLNAYKVTSHDLTFVETKAIGGSRDKMTVKVVAKRKNAMCQIVMEVLNHLVFGVPYVIEYPKAK